MTLPGNLPANKTTGDTFTASDENAVESAVNQDTAAIATGLRRASRNTIAALGDSITWWGDVLGNYGPTIGHNHLQQLQILTHQRIRFDGADFAISGTNLNNALTVQLPQVLALNPLPGACVIAAATNDLDQVSSPNPNFGTMKTTLKTIVASLLNAGIAPILWCVPPNTFGSSGTYQANIHQWNTWIRRYSSINGFAVIDAHAACAAIDGTYISGLGQTDLIHPSGAGQRAIAQQAISDGIADIFPPGSLIHTARQTNDLSNMFNNGTLNLGLFTTDANSDGVADGLTAAGPGPFSLVNPLSSDNLYGKWQQMTASTGQVCSLQASITTGWSVGDVIAFSCRVQTRGVEASGATYDVVVLTDTPGGYTIPGGSSVTALYNGMTNWLADVEDGELYVEFTVLSTMTDMNLLVWLPSVVSGTATVRVGEVTIRNLTTGGLLT